MRKIIATLALSVTFSGLAVDAPAQTNYHRIYLEPDFAWNLPYKQTYEQQSLKEWGQYYGFVAGYEFQKPNFIYAGLEVFISLGNRFGEWRIDNMKVFEYETMASKNKVEGHLGYTLSNGRFSLTPFSGTGAYFLDNNNTQLNVAFIPIGLNASCQLENLNIGVKGEQIHYLHTWEHLSDNTKYSTNVWNLSPYGYEISLPLSFQVEGYSGKWFGAIEPYYLKLFSDMAFVGGRISAIHEF